jgi:hypothetical protein
MDKTRKCGIVLMIAGTLVFLECLVVHHPAAWYNAAGIFIGFLVGMPMLIDREI